MAQRLHEVRDPVHVFVYFDDDERQVINCPRFQRLRSIHQLSLSSLVYPGASHKRFEHSLGVMELAGRIFDVITRQPNVGSEVQEFVPREGERDHGYWRSALRMAALCHDMGHLPFSHAAEGLLPDGWDHERFTWEIVHSPEMSAVWKPMKPKPEAEDVGKLALGPRTVEKLRLGLSFSPWEAILADIIGGDVFGADRMDYLLRDSIHLGVAYGRFDHNRLIDTLRVLPRAPQEKGQAESREEIEPALGCERGGLQSAEALLLARYFMFAQVYYHHTRLAYDEHLKDFLEAWLPGNQFSVDLSDHVALTDNEVLSAIATAAADSTKPGHDPALRMVTREHFRVARQRQPDDTAGATKALAEAAEEEFGRDKVRYGASPKRGDPPDFPVRGKDGASRSSLSLSDVMRTLPVSRDEYVLASRDVIDDVQRWLAKNDDEIVEQARATAQREDDEEVTG